MKRLLTRLWKEEEGQDLAEYALVLVLLSLAAVGSTGHLARAINHTYKHAGKQMPT